VRPLSKFRSQWFRRVAAAVFLATRTKVFVIFVDQSVGGAIAKQRVDIGIKRVQKVLAEPSASALIKSSAAHEIIFRFREDLNPHLSRSRIETLALSQSENVASPDSTFLSVSFKTS
jgi:hypothetical protein